MTSLPMVMPPGMMCCPRPQTRAPYPRCQRISQGWPRLQPAIAPPSYKASAPALVAFAALAPLLPAPRRRMHRGRRLAGSTSAPSDRAPVRRAMWPPRRSAKVTSSAYVFRLRRPARQPPLELTASAHTSWELASLISSPGPRRTLYRSLRAGRGPWRRSYVRIAYLTPAPPLRRSPRISQPRYPMRPQQAPLQHPKVRRAHRAPSFPHRLFLRSPPPRCPRSPPWVPPWSSRGYGETPNLMGATA